MVGPNGSALEVCGSMKILHQGDMILYNQKDVVLILISCSEDHTKLSVFATNKPLKDKLSIKVLQVS